MSLCPLCGEPLKRDGEFNICITGCTAYIDSDTQSMNEIVAYLDSRECHKDDKLDF